MAMEIKAATQAASESASSAPMQLRWGAKVTATDVLFFTEQLELLLSTGVNLHSALEALRGQSTNPAFRELLGQISQDVVQGRPFSQALAKHPEVFSQTYVTLIGAAENGGFLHEVLRQLLEMEEKREELRSTLVSALSYPIFLAVFSLAVVAFILVFVFPKFGQMFISIKDQLPSTTLALMWASDMLRHQWMVISLLMLGIAVVVFQWSRSELGQRQLSSLKLSLPGLRGIFVAVYLVQCLRTMGTSLKNGVSLVDTLRSCRGIVNNRIVQQFLESVETSVKDGVGFSVAFSRGDFLPPLVKQMMATGDETGNLGLVMLRIADYYERELEKRLSRLSKVAEPFMLLVMGSIVGVLVSSLILPIFKLTRAVG